MSWVWVINWTYCLFMQCMFLIFCFFLLCRPNTVFCFGKEEKNKQLIISWIFLSDGCLYFFSSEAWHGWLIIAILPAIYVWFQIRQYRRLEDGSVNIVARGQQRFRLRRRWVGVEGAVSTIFKVKSVCITDFYVWVLWLDLSQSLSRHVERFK